MLLMH